MSDMDERAQQCAKHKQDHINYWATHNRQTDPQIFEEGFITGWMDGESPSCPNRDALLGQRHREHAQHRGDSPCEWAFDDGYHEGFDSRRAWTKPQVDTTDERTTQCAKHKQDHINYWANHNRQTDPQIFEEGFVTGWMDAETPSCPNRDSLLAQRHREHAQHRGDSPYEWAFNDGYHEGFDSRRALKIDGHQQEDTTAERSAQCEKHKNDHINYWRSHGNKQTDPARFQEGFVTGWLDAENPSYANKDTMLSQRHRDHVQHNGDSPCEWAYDDGYREGFDSRRSWRPVH